MYPLRATSGMNRPVYSQHLLLPQQSRIVLLRAADSFDHSLQRGRPDRTKWASHLTLGDIGSFQRWAVVSAQKMPRASCGVSPGGTIR
jgi:hypothetical protein